MSARAPSRQRSLSNQRSVQPQPYNYKGKENAPITPFEPCAATGSLFLYAEGSNVICLHHDTLALEREFKNHTHDIRFICVDNVSERGQGRLVVTYDASCMAIVWDLLTGEQISRFQSFETLTAAAWMRNGNLTFGNEKGELILFEPATSEHVSARTIYDPVTAIAPSADCKTFAIGYRNGSILLAALQPAFTILHTLSTSRAPSEISALSWHASSSKQKSDMLATNTIDGDLRVWSVAKPPGSSQPRVIRTLHRSDSFDSSRSWISWSKNGRILQLYEGVTWSWDVRTKDMSYVPIPTVESIRGIAAYGPTGTLFTLGPDHTVQQYDVDGPQMVANVRHVPLGVPQTPPQEIIPSSLGSGSETDFMSPRRELRYGAEATSMDNTHLGVLHSGHRRSRSRGSQPPEARSFQITSPATKTERTVTTISLGAQSEVMGQLYSPSSTKSARKASRLRQEVVISPEERMGFELFPFTRARLSDIPYKQPTTTESTSLTPDDLRKQMLNVVFGWQGDIHSLVNDELSRHPADSPNAVFLARWLGTEPNRVIDAFRSSTANSSLDWMRLALNSIGGKHGDKKMAQVLTQKLLTHGDLHAAACLLMSIGEYNDAIEVYVSSNFHMEAILLTCLLMPSDWQRQSHLVRRWGEHVVQQSQQHLAVRCFSCTSAEPTEPWTSPTAQNAALGLQENGSRLQPSIYHKTMERRGLQDPSPQNTLAPAVAFPVTGPGQLSHIPEDGGLKLITTFGKDNFRFPGLMSDDGTPINAALVTPIAESAFPRSAISPVGTGSHKINNMRSISGALASRSNTPATLQRIRLPSIGEAPIDTESAKHPAALVPRPPPTPADSGSDKEKGNTSQNNEDKKVVHSQLPMLLTPARYEPDIPAVGETPQTVIAAQSVLTFADRRPSDIERPASARPRGSSRSRKPDGLSVSTISTHASQSNQELLLPAVYGASIQRPATTTAIYGTPKVDFTPPNTGNSLTSLRSLKSPASTSGRSLDQYISSLEQAQLYKPSRSRGNSTASKQSKDELAERKYKNAMKQYENGRDRSNSIPISAAKRSPSSPVPMSPEELRLHSGSVENIDPEYLSNTSSTNRKDSGFLTGDGSHRDSATIQGTRQRRRSRSRAEGRSHGSSRHSSRRHSPDPETGKRGRSKGRKEGSSTRSPESPIPMIPSEEDLQGVQNTDPALKFVAQNRQRLHRSSSRRDSSTDRRTTRMRSRSRQPEPIDTGMTRNSGHSTEGDQRYPQDLPYDPRQMESAGLAIERVSSTSETDRTSFKNLQHLPHGRRKELAQAELEARRLSLTRRPSAPAVPLPGQSVSSPLALEYAPPLLRAQTDQGLPTLSSLSSQYPVRPDSAGLGRSRPQTPRAMRHPAHGQKSVPELPKLGEMLGSNMYYVPKLPDTTSPRKGRSSSFTSPEIPLDMPMHPAFDSSIATSRPGSSNTIDRTMSPANGVLRDRRPTQEPRNDYPVMTIGEEDYSEVELVYASPPVVPELQHLAMPPPPPPPPPPPQALHDLQEQDFMSGLRIQTDSLPAMSNIPLPQTAYAVDPTTAVSPSDRLRQDRSVNDKQLTGKIRHFAGRMRSTSRGRSQSHGRGDNPTRSPNIGGDETVSPYESLSQSAQQTYYHLARVAERR